MSFWAKLAAWLNPPDPGPLVFEPEWREHLEAGLPLYARLPEELRERLHGKITQFVRDKFFEGCGGVELTDRMVLSIAGQACLLSVMHEGDPYPLLRSVLIYPSSYRARETYADALGVVHEREVVRLGESWSNGTVVLAWDAVKQGATNIFDGHNVTLHEFAHQLDQADGRGDGTPRLASAACHAQWRRVMEAGKAELDRKVAAGRRTVLDRYGSTNEAEYFAVATETFFEKPRQLARKQPELYAVLRDYYQLHPAEWFTQG